MRDLWEKGYCMGGSKLGGYWLVYPGACVLLPHSISLSILFTAPPHTCVYTCMHPDTGDPLRYHSHFVATVKTSPSTPLLPMEVVAHGRLGTATKKARL